MQILVFNAGSSSLKFGVFDVGAETREMFKGSYERFRDGSFEYRFGTAKRTSGARPPSPVPATR